MGFRRQGVIPDPRDLESETEGKGEESETRGGPGSAGRVREVVLLVRKPQRILKL